MDSRRPRSGGCGAVAIRQVTGYCGFCVHCPTVTTSGHRVISVGPTGRIRRRYLRQGRRARDSTSTGRRRLPMRRTREDRCRPLAGAAPGTGARPDRADAAQCARLQPEAVAFNKDDRRLPPHGHRRLQLLHLFGTPNLAALPTSASSRATRGLRTTRSAAPSLRDARRPAQPVHRSLGRQLPGTPHARHRHHRREARGATPGDRPRRAGPRTRRTCGSRCAGTDSARVGLIHL